MDRSISGPRALASMRVAPPSTVAVAAIVSRRRPPTLTADADASPRTFGVPRASAIVIVPSIPPAEMSCQVMSVPLNRMATDCLPPSG